jgi:hypothetical protein
MRKALDDSAAVQIYREFVNLYQLGYDVRPAGEPVFPAFAGSLDLRHATPSQAPSASPSRSASVSPSTSASASPAGSASASPSASPSASGSR